MYCWPNNGVIYPIIKKYTLSTHTEAQKRQVDLGFQLKHGKVGVFYCLLIFVSVTAYIHSSVCICIYTLIYIYVYVYIDWHW